MWFRWRLEQKWARLNPRGGVLASIRAFLRYIRGGRVSDGVVKTRVEGAPKRWLSILDLSFHIVKYILGCAIYPAKTTVDRS